MKNDMCVQGFILEDFLWKNQMIRSQTGLEITAILDGGEGMERVWVGSGVALIFIGFFWEFFMCKEKGLTQLLRASSGCT